MPLRIHVDQLGNFTGCPSRRNVADVGGGEGVGKLGEEGLWHAAEAGGAGGLGADGLEIYEPRPEHRARDVLQRPVHFPQQIDLVVQINSTFAMAAATSSSTSGI